jgi:hypothetical protein
MPLTPEQIKHLQAKDAQKQALAQNPTATGNGATLPAVRQASVPATVDNRDAVDRVLDDIAPSFLAGPMVGFNGKKEKFVITASGDELDIAVKYKAHLGQARMEWIKFHGKGETPEKNGDFLFDPGFILTPRDDLGDLDMTEWPPGLDGQPRDPWILQVMFPLQNTETLETFTFLTSSKTGRSAVGTLLKAHKRKRLTHPNETPVVLLKVSSYQSKDRGKVAIPAFVVVGRAPSEDEPALSRGADMEDEIPF